MPQRKLASIAKEYYGAKEAGNNLAGDDPKMQEIFEADDLWLQGRTDGYPWCAAFISLCVQKLLQEQSQYYQHITPPRLASVSRFYIWAKRQNCIITKPDKNSVFVPVIGDIVVFTFSHIGIITSYDNGTIITIEGNTSESGSREGTIVMQKERCPSVIRAFIRLPIQ